MSAFLANIISQSSDSVHLTARIPAPLKASLLAAGELVPGGMTAVLVELLKQAQERGDLPRIRTQEDPGQTKMNL